MRRSRVALGVGVVIVAAWWLASSRGEESAEATDREHAADRKVTGEFRDAVANARRSNRSGRIDLNAIPTEGSVTIAGTVLDRLTQQPVGNVEVVFLGPGGEETAMAGADGKYRIELVAGAYRAFVRDDFVFSVGAGTFERLPGLPEADDIGAPDQNAMPLVVAQQDVDNVDLRVLRGGVVQGRVVDKAGRPVANAIVRAFGTGGVRPALGTDNAETDANGHYEMRLPTGHWTILANHARFAALDETRELSMAPGERVDLDLTLVAGCVIAGKVLGPDGLPAGDGAIEVAVATAFSPAGKIKPDGSFRWTTTREDDIELRAWPWKSPPSESQTFACHDGARFEVTFRLPRRGADIEGVLVDATGAPIPHAYIDLTPLDENGISQQERSDGDGKWGVFSMPAGRYLVNAYAPGRGVISMEVRSPQKAVRLQLGGTGRVDGTVTGLANGSFELEMISCSINGERIKTAEAARIVSVRDGKFSIADLPACDMYALAKAREGTQRIDFTVKAGTSVPLAIDFTNIPKPDLDDGPLEEHIEEGLPLDDVPPPDDDPSVY